MNSAKINTWFTVVYTVVFPLTVALLWYFTAVERVKLQDRIIAADIENDLWRSMVAEIPGGVFRISVPDGMIVYANDGASELTGYSAEELVGHSMLDFNIAPKLEMHRRFLGDVEFHRNNTGLWLSREGMVGHKVDGPVLRRVAIRPYYDSNGLPKWMIFISPLLAKGTE